jgi:hypothetical protein
MTTTQTPNMALYEWVNNTDYFSHTQLVSNWGSIDNHDHSSGKGQPIKGDTVGNGGGLVAGSITVAALATAVLNQMFVVGDLVSSINTTRSGFLLLDGSTFPTSSYPNLAALCGPYQLGNEGTGRTRLPDFRGRLPIGSQNNTPGTATRATAWPLGYKNATPDPTGPRTVFTGPGNEEAHIQLTTELAQHTPAFTEPNSGSGHLHNVNGTTGNTSSNHTHGFSGTTSDQSGIPNYNFAALNAFDNIISAGVAGGTSDTVPRAATYGDNNWTGTGMGHTHTYSGNTGGQNSDHNHAMNFNSGYTTTGIVMSPIGSSTPFNIMPPVIGVNWFVKHD